MAKKQPTEVLRRKERVRAAADLRGVPEGTPGRVMMTNGFSWIRYWVEFDNGVEMGSINRDSLVRVAQWDQYLRDREQAAEAAASAPDLEPSAAESDPVADASAGSGGGGLVNGVEVPQLLLDRTTAALERFGVSR